LYSHQITAWRAEILAHFATRPTLKKDARDETIRQLEREILRKDNALAEAAALRILQKKVDLIWGSRDEAAK
jgi:transposase